VALAVQRDDAVAGPSSLSSSSITIAANVDSSDLNTSVDLLAGTPEFFRTLGGRHERSGPQM
jgi:hypothetical protein